MIIDTDKLLQYLNLDATSDYIDNLVQTSENSINQYCDQPLEMTTITEFFDGNNDTLLKFRNFPVNSILLMRYRETPISVLTTIDNDKYKLIYTDHVYHCYYEFFSEGIANYEITYNVGYDKVPYEVGQVGIEIVATMYKESEAAGGSHGGRLGLQQVNEATMQGYGGSTITYKDLLPKWKLILDMYRLPRY